MSQPHDAPAVRAILRRAEADDYRLTSLIQVRRHASDPFQHEESIVMILTKKSLPRRTFLRGMGAAIALPLLDAMVPSMTAWAKTAAQTGAATGFRLCADGLRHHALASGRRQPVRSAQLSPSP